MDSYRAVSREREDGLWLSRMTNEVPFCSIMVLRPALYPFRTSLTVHPPPNNQYPSLTSYKYSQVLQSLQVNNKALLKKNKTS